MNKSKLLKKSLAALLAILLVAAMIPMSAFAADGDAIYVDGIQAVLEDGSYSVTLQYDQENVAAKVGAVEFKLSSLKGTTVTLLDKDGKNPLTASLSGVPGTDSAKRTISLNTTGIDAPAGKTYGEYKMVVRVQDAGAAAAQDYPLTITVKERAKRRNVAIAEDDGVTGDNVVSYSVNGNVITVVKAIGVSKDSMQPIITAADTASKIENVSSSKQFIDTASAATTYKDTPYRRMLKGVQGTAGNSYNDSVVANAVRVRAEDGSYQDYTINYVTENVFESISVKGTKGESQIGNVVYSEPKNYDGVVYATFEVPYGKANNLIPTFKTTADVEGIVTSGANSRNDANPATTHGTVEAGKGGSYFYLDSETVGRRDVSGKAILNMSTSSTVDTTTGILLYVSTVNQKLHHDVATSSATGKSGLPTNLVLRAVAHQNTEAKITDVAVATSGGSYDQDKISVSNTTATQNIYIGDEDASIGSSHNLKFYVPKGAVVTISNWNNGVEHVVAEVDNSDPNYTSKRYGDATVDAKATFSIDVADIEDIEDIEKTKTYEITIGSETKETGAVNATGSNPTAAEFAAAIAAVSFTDWTVQVDATTNTQLNFEAKVNGPKAQISSVGIAKGTTDAPTGDPSVSSVSASNWVNGSTASAKQEGVVEFAGVPVKDYTTTPLRVVVTSEDKSTVANYNFIFAPKPTTPATVNGIAVIAANHPSWAPATARTIDGDDVVILDHDEVPTRIDVSVSNGATAKTVTSSENNGGSKQDHTGRPVIFGDVGIAADAGTNTGATVYVPTANLDSTERAKGYFAKIIVHAFYGADGSGSNKCNAKSEKVFYIKQNAARTEELMTYAHVTYSKDISNLDVNETNVFDVRNINHDKKLIQIDVPYAFNLTDAGDIQDTDLYLYKDEDWTVSDGYSSVENFDGNEPMGLDFSTLGDQTTALTADDYMFAKLLTANNNITTQADVNSGNFVPANTNTVPITVTAENTAKSREYRAYAVRQAASSACDLNSISSPDKKVTIELDDVPGTNRYIITVPYSYNTESYDRKKTPSFDITFDVSKNATVQDGSTTDPMKFFGPNVTSRSFAVSGGRLYYNGKLVSGDSFVVKAEDGTATKQYLFTVKTLPANTDSTITSITVGDREAVAGENKTFTATVPYGKLRQKLAIVLGSELSKVTINERDYEPDREYDLTNELPITVTAEDGSTSVYKLTVTEAEPSTEAELVSLKVGEFNAKIDGTAVTAKIGENADLTKQVLTIEVSPAASYTVAGRVYDNTEIAVNEPVEIVVTAEDGKTTKTYTLTVLAEDVKTGNTISGASVDGVDAAIADTAITAEADDPASVTLELTLPEGAAATVDGVEYTPGMTVNASSPVTIVVTAEDGGEKTYTLTVAKKGGATLDGVKDVPAGAWYADAVADMLSRGIMTANSQGNFRPSETVTRGQFAVMMCQLYGVNPADYANAQNPFTDIKKGDWFYNAALAAVDHDWMAGTSKTTFSPKDPVTREQTALIIAKAQGLTKVEAPAEAYSDDARIASWAKGWVYACKDAGLMSYMSTSQKTFNPKGELTRAQMAMILTHIDPETNKPEDPDEGNTPETPDEGNTPETPDEGNTPETPDEGNTPEDPDEGNTPEDPDEGNTPETPDEGNTPEDPDEGNTPETPAE